MRDNSPEQQPRLITDPTESGQLSTTSLSECQDLVALSQLLRESSAVSDRRGSMTYASKYWMSRCEYEQTKLQAIAEHATQPHFYYLGDKDTDIDLRDARARKNLYETLMTAQKLGVQADANDYGLTNERLAADEVLFKKDQLAKNKQAGALAFRSSLRSIRSHVLCIAGLYEDTPAKQLLSAGTLEPVSLLKTPIRKADITPTILSVLAGTVHGYLLEAASEGEVSGRTTRTAWKEETMRSAADKIIDAYLGTVSAVVGIKLPVTPTFIDEYFSKQNVSGVLPDRITRLQFDATLAPTGKKPFVSRVHTVVYRAVNEKGDHRVVTTVRKADRLMAELAISSLLREARAARTIIDSNSYEVLAGLPSLGKSAR